MSCPLFRPARPASPEASPLTAEAATREGWSLWSCTHRRSGVGSQTCLERKWFHLSGQSYLPYQGTEPGRVEEGMHEANCSLMRFSLLRRLETLLLATGPKLIKLRPIKQIYKIFWLLINACIHYAYISHHVLICCNTYKQCNFANLPKQWLWT